MTDLRLLLLALTAAPLIAAAAPPPHARPNVLVILTDDQGWGDLSINGNSNLATPNIDGLATAGASFDRFYVQPVCSPTRAEFLTGRYHPRGGVRGVSTGGERLDLDERTIADAFHAAGYATGCFGKWHNGTQYPYHPRGRGFDTYYGFTSGHWGDYFDPPLDHDGALVRGNGFIVDDLTDRAVAFMTAAHAARHPFFCYLAIPTPHTPAQVPDAFYAKFANADLAKRGGKGEDPDKTRAVLAMCENTDANVGRALAKLDTLGIARDTVVVYFHDNGPNGARWNGGMRGVKASTDEGGVRSPLLIRWPATIRPGLQIPQIAGAIDLLPTLADLAGVPLGDGDKSVDGVSLKPLLTAAAPPAAWPDRTLVAHWNGKVSVRSQTHRLDATGRLYDMTADPGQTTDVATRQPDVATRLKTAAANWRRDVLAELAATPNAPATPNAQADPRPFPVGHPAFPVTQLPARDGVGHGAVKRSAPAPNCSFFTNWTASPDDRITWDVEIAAAGRYEAVVHYTCPAADVGSTVELSLNGVAVQARVADAHDPPLRGAENDRVKRDSESYVKDFRPLPLGTLDLKPGRGPLTLRALNVPGRTVMDVRLVTLTLVK